MINKEQLITDIYKILLLYEDVTDENSVVQKQDYLAYLDRLYVYWVGMDCREVYNIVKGLRVLGLEVEHQVVKSMVFHVIDVIHKMEVGE